MAVGVILLIAVFVVFPVSQRACGEGIRLSELDGR